MPPVVLYTCYLQLFQLTTNTRGRLPVSLKQNCGGGALRFLMWLSLSAWVEVSLSFYWERVKYICHCWKVTFPWDIHTQGAQQMFEHLRSFFFYPLVRWYHPFTMQWPKDYHSLSRIGCSIIKSKVAWDIYTQGEQQMFDHLQSVSFLSTCLVITPFHHDP